jgi:hypothetical protein
LVLITLRSLKYHPWEDNINLYLKERGCKAVDWLKIGLLLESCEYGNKKSISDETGLKAVDSIHLSVLWVACTRHPQHTQTNSNSSTIAADNNTV